MRGDVNLSAGFLLCIIDLALLVASATDVFFVAPATTASVALAVILSGVVLIELGC